MKKRPIIRNVTIKPSTHAIVRAEKKRTGIPIKVLVDHALVFCYAKKVASV